MCHAITNATRSIYWEVYIFVDDQAGRTFFDILEAKARAGVDVKLILDWWGSFSVSRARVEALRQAGVDVQLFHERRRRYRGLWSKLISRTHRKILIVDEAIGFLGGVNIRHHMRDWLDIHVRIKGIAIHSLLRAFAKMYVISGGKKEAVRHLFVYPLHVMSDEVEFLYDDASKRQSRIRGAYVAALRQARKRVILFSPYYFPDRHFLLALWQARKRGVRVDLLIPFRTDVRVATYAAYAWFGIMAKAGVRVHLLRRMMHGKGVMIDEEMAIFGTSNLEHTSFYDNYEANVRVKDKKTVRRLWALLGRWMAEAELLDVKRWEKRGLWHRFKEWLAYRLYRLWHHHP